MRDYRAYFGPRWGAEESEALSRRPNPARAALEQDVQAFLSAGGQIKPAGAPRSLSCVKRAGAGTSGRRNWVQMPPDSVYQSRHPK